MQKKILGIVLAVLMLTFAMVGCGASKQSESMAVSDYAMEAPAMEAVEEMAVAEEVMNRDSASDAGYAEGSFEGDAEAASAERIVLKDANLRILVEDPASIISDIALMAERLGGFVVSSNVYTSYYYEADKELPQGYIQVRVPAEDLNSAMSEIKGMTQDPKYDVTSESISGQDVTSQYTDLESRLRNLEDAQEQMQVFLDEAKSTEDVMMVYTQLKSINEEIEIIKGQLKYFDEASRLSSIYVEVMPKYEVTTIDVGGWEPQGVAKKAIQALINAFHFLVEALIWIVMFLLPVLLMISLPLVIVIVVIRWLTRKSRKKRQAAKKANTTADKDIK